MTITSKQKFDLGLKKYFLRTDQNYGSEPHKKSKTFWLQKKVFCRKKFQKKRFYHFKFNLLYKISVLCFLQGSLHTLDWDQENVLPNWAVVFACFGKKSRPREESAQTANKSFSVGQTLPMGCSNTQGLLSHKSMWQGCALHCSCREWQTGQTPRKCVSRSWTHYCLGSALSLNYVEWAMAHFVRSTNVGILWRPHTQRVRVVSMALRFCLCLWSQDCCMNRQIQSIYWTCHTKFPRRMGTL